MRAPKTVLVGGTTYIETDLIITNALADIYKESGGNPVVYQILTGVSVGNAKYILRISPKTMARYADAINENEPDQCCGQVVVKQNYSKQISTYTVAQGQSNLFTTQVTDINTKPGSPQIILEVPKFQTRGVVTSRLLGTGSNDLFVGQSNIGAVSKDEIIKRFKSYLADTTDAGKQLFYYDPKSTSGGGKVQLKTWDDVFEKYSNYFVHEYEMSLNSQSTLSGSFNAKGFYADGQWYESGSIGLWDAFKMRGLSSESIRKELLDSGYTLEQVNKFLNQPKSSSSTSRVGSIGGPGGSGSGGSGGGGGSGSGGGNGYVDDGLPGVDSGALTTISIQRSRNLFADSVNVNNSFIIKNNSEKDKYLNSPQIFQLVPTINEDLGFLDYVTNRYIFTHRPNDIQYSGLGSEWVTIDRTAGFSFVDWKKFQLLQISLSFVIAKDGDGLIAHVEDEIKLLRKIAQTPYPVSFFNFDSMFTQQFRYDDLGNSRGIQFVITDFSINAQQRDKSMRVTRAQANLTLQEIPIEAQTLIAMPRLTSKNPPPPPPPGSTSEEFRLPSDANSSNYGKPVGWINNEPEEDK